MIRFRVGEWLIAVWPSEILGLLILAIGLVFFVVAHRARGPFDLARMFVWPGTNQTSLALVLAFWGGLCTMWIVIDQELKGRLSDTALLGFIGIIVTGKGLTEAINAWRAKAAPPSATP